MSSKVSNESVEIVVAEAAGVALMWTFRKCRRSRQLIVRLVETGSALRAEL